MGMNQIVMRDNAGKNKFSCNYFVLKAAQVDGGAHVDSSSDEQYVRLSRRNSLGINDIIRENEVVMKNYLS